MSLNEKLEIARLIAVGVLITIGLLVRVQWIVSATAVAVGLVVIGIGIFNVYRDHKRDEL